MFGYQGGESQQITRRKIRERRTAQAKWPFLTSLDLSMIHNEEQLTYLVKDRTGGAIQEVRPIVHDWMGGYRQRAVANAASGRRKNKPANNNGKSPRERSS
jgi:hypothetical protein